MNDKRYRAALIGLGRIADTIDDETVGSGWLAPFSHMGSYMDVGEVQVVGAADLYAEQRAAFGRRWSIDEEHLYEVYRRRTPLRELPGDAGTRAARHSERLYLCRASSPNHLGHRPNGT